MPVCESSASDLASTAEASPPDSGSLRILQVVTRNELRGAEVFAGQLAEQLASRGHSVRIAALYESRDESHLSPSGFDIVELRARHNGFVEPSTLTRLRRQIAAFRPDVIQANGFHALRSCAILRRLRLIEQPLAYRNISVASRWIRGGLRRIWGTWIARTADIVLSVSDASACDFAAAYRLKRDRVRTLRRGVVIPASTDRNTARARVEELTGIPPDSPLLFHIGGFTPEKNHAGLLDAFVRVLEHVPDARLIMLGDGPMHADTLRRIEQSGLAEHAIAPGHRTDARDLLEAADLLLLPSHVEGLPGVVLEAGARRVPVVATRVGAADEVVDTGRSGILVDADDMTAMADAAIDLLNDESKRHAMGDALYDAVVREFHLDRSVRRFEDVYRDMCG